MGENNGLHNLSPRERECLRLVAQGLSTYAIADEIKKSSHTVEAHIRSARTKLGGVTRAAAAEVLARAEGFQSLASKRLVIPRSSTIADECPSVSLEPAHHKLSDSTTHEFELPADWAGETDRRAMDDGAAQAIPVRTLAWTSVKTALAVIALLVLALASYDSLRDLVKSLALRDMPPKANEGIANAQPTTGRRTTRP